MPSRLACLVLGAGIGSLIPAAAAAAAWRFLGHAPFNPATD